MDQLHDLHLWQFQAIRDTAIIAGIIFIIWLGYWLQSVTVPLLIALTLAYLLEPLVVKLCDRFKANRPVVVGGMLCVICLAFILFLALVPLLFAQGVQLLKQLPDHIASLYQFALDHIPEDQRATLTEDPEQLRTTVSTWLDTNLGTLVKASVQTAGDALGLIADVIGSVVYTAFAIFLVMFYFFFFSTGWGRLQDYISELFPEEHLPRAYELTRKMDLAVSGFVRGRVVISIIMGVMLSVGWAFCGVPYWLLIGMLTGVLCIVPYLGGLGIPVAVILLWLGQSDLPEAQQMAWWGIIIWPVLVFTIVQLVEAYLLTPMIAGKATNLGPVSIFVAVLAGGIVMGMYGMLLAIPIAACLKILAIEIMVPRIKEWVQGKAEDILPISRT
ncbi:MAG: AI-2E family transporter [Planctomycetes bacterium]|nr:AI-2E family transporter [Planctomycetota bacterium]